NGDGLSDFGVTSTGVRSREGRAYVIWGSEDTGKTSEWLNLGDLGARGLRIVSAEGNWLSSFAGGMTAGDFDGDGRRDLAISEGTRFFEKRVTVIFGIGGEPPSVPTFVRGEVNGDANIDLSDGVAILGYLFLGTAGPTCLDAADVDDSGQVNLADPVALLNHLFQGTSAPPPPYPEPGVDPTA